MTTAPDSLPAPLRRVRDELDEATARLRKLCRSANPDIWETRPAQNKWSAAECIAHLNLTSEAFLPLIREALAQASPVKQGVSAGYRRDFMGWLLCVTLEPPPRFRVGTSSAFTAQQTESIEAACSRFERLQQEVSETISSAVGLNLNRTRIRSPFDSRVKYNVYSAWRILAVHQRRHLWQAEQAMQV